MSQTNPFTALLAAQPFVLLDGAMATELEARGCDLADSLWSAKVLLENPQLIRDLHLDYFRAGAQVAITASYQATPAGFAARGLDEAQSRALIGKSVELARKAREAYLAENPQAGTLLVAGSVGPYGAFLADGSEYRGDYQRSAAEFQAFHRPRVEALLDAGADLLACETLPSFAEIQALAALLQEYPRARAWYSFTLRDAEHLSDGTPLREVMAALAPTGPVYQAGTLSGNPIAMAAGFACLNEVAQPGVHETLTELTNQLAQGLLDAARDAGIPLVVNNVGGMFGIFFTDAETVTCYQDVVKCDVERFKRFFHLMLEEGVYLAPSAFEAGFMSVAHSEEDIDNTIDAARRVFAKL